MTAGRSPARWPIRGDLADVPPVVLFGRSSLPVPPGLSRAAFGETYPSATSWSAPPAARADHRSRHHPSAHFHHALSARQRH